MPPPSLLLFFPLSRIRAHVSSHHTRVGPSRSVLYAVGTILSLVGTGFLVGFWKQVKMVSFDFLPFSCPSRLSFPSSPSPSLSTCTAFQMFNPVRLIASIVFLGSIVLVFVGAFVVSFSLHLRRPLHNTTLILLASDRSSETPSFASSLSSSLTSRSRGTLCRTSNLTRLFSLSLPLVADLPSPLARPLGSDWKQIRPLRSNAGKELDWQGNGLIQLFPIQETRRVRESTSDGTSERGTEGKGRGTAKGY